MNNLKEKIIIAASFMDEPDTNTLWNLILEHFPGRPWDNIEETVFHKYDSNTLYALRILQVISQDKEKRLEYEAREKAIRDHNQMMFEAEQRGIEISEQRGIEIGKYSQNIEIARSMKKEGIRSETISKITGFSAAEIDSL